ncbi:RING-CH-type domain-containing protein [Caerostris extrusa]|uniref:RING-CH-type domain-containing protein n=1 Tax=Caerostris extrusa TaxID=172846 RepID=A0AAV4RDW1_CAEEX|nr:RING-CH-type domain-containing protein [Caerostris extrusa]
MIALVMETAITVYVSVKFKYSGGTCRDPNLNYYIAFSTIFYFICAVSFIQLLLCIKAEFSRMKPHSILKAFNITTQKTLYILICLATALRRLVFSSQEHEAMLWASSLMSAYYPILLSGSSLIVCFWAEIFHLRDLTYEKPGFLSKSLLGFIMFNIITYSLLLAELLLLQFSDTSEVERTLFVNIFHGCYALLMCGGEFLQGSSSTTDTSQLHQSRIGLVSQAVLLLFTVVFIFSDSLGDLWKAKVPVISRNCYNIVFRVVEMGVALWFPCVLWNCVRPEQLWILNPRKLLRKLEIKKQIHSVGEDEALVSSAKEITIVKAGLSKSLEKIPECWICYDPERLDCGPLIQPCKCRGDVSVVHHECLKQWLVESSSHPDATKCKVCNESYELQQNTIWLPKGLTPMHWMKTGAIISVMCSYVAGACFFIQAFENVGIRTLAGGSAILVVYVCLRLLGFSILKGYQRAKFSAVKILNHNLNGGQTEVLLNLPPPIQICANSHSSSIK